MKIGCIGLIAAALCCSRPASGQEPPNFLVLIADDLGWRDLGCYGNPYIETPHLDRLAAEGVQFENAFLTTPQCSPSRISMLTGRYPHATGAEDLHIPLPDSLRIVPHFLREQGYFSGLLKKSHLGENGDRQFDYLSPSLDEFSAFLDQAGDRPFFLWVGFTDPHRPYESGILPRPQHPDSVRVPVYLLDDDSTRLDLADYYNEVRRMDGRVGAFLNTLEDRGQLENTIVLFLSDNGAPFPRAKGTVYDAGIKTPLLIRGPGWPAGEKRTQLVSAVDLAPTILELAGVRRPENMQGRSMVPALSGKTPPSAFREAVYAERNWHNTDEHIRCVRSADYKLIENAYLERPLGIASDIGNSYAWRALLRAKADGVLAGPPALIFRQPRSRYELYDLRQDPEELRNVADHPDYAEVKDSLLRRLAAWKKNTGDFPPDERRRPDNVDRATGRKFWPVKAPDFLDNPPYDKPPNVLLILADDLGFSDLGCYGGEIETPHLDELAAGGVRFSQFYNSAKCSPSRAALITGHYPHAAGVGDVTATVKRVRRPGAYQGYLKKDSILTLAEVLGSAGYRTYLSGKWHMGETKPHWPLTRGFDRYFGLISGASSYYELIKDQPRDRIMALDSSRWEPPAEGLYMTDALTDSAVAMIIRHQAEFPDRPFFQYLAYTAPHWPLHAPDDAIAKYEHHYNQGWDATRRARLERIKTLGLLPHPPDLSAREPEVPPWTEAGNRSDWARRMAVHAAMVDRMDAGIGQVVATLKATGQFDNTIIIFLSDNGASAESLEERGLHDPGTPIGRRGSYVGIQAPWANVSDAPFRKYKLHLYEGGISTPFILHYPGSRAPQGSIRHQPAHLIDVLPTVLDIANVPYPDRNGGVPAKPLSGVSLLPAMLDGAKHFNRPLFWEFSGRRAMRDGDWKIVRPRKGEWELYNLREDRAEQNNLAASQPERLAAMVAAWEAWAKEVGVFDEK